MASLAAYLDAIEAFTHAIELQPTFAPAYLARGIVYWRELNDHTRAVRDCTSAIALAPQNADAYLNRGFARVYGAIGSHADAIADFEHYLALGPNGYWRVEAQNQITRLSTEPH